MSVRKEKKKTKPARAPFDEYDSLIFSLSLLPPIYPRCTENRDPEIRTKSASASSTLYLYAVLVVVCVCVFFAPAILVQHTSISSRTNSTKHPRKAVTAER